MTLRTLLLTLALACAPMSASAQGGSASGEELETEARARLYEQLAGLFRGKVAFPEDAVFGLSDEQYVRNVVESIFRSRKPATAG